MPTFNTTDPKPGYVYDSATDTWFPLVGIAPASQVDRWTKTAAGGETSLSGNDDNAVSLSYTAGTEQVYLNGVLLARGSDYTATNGTTITGLTALAASDIAEVITFNPSNILTTDAVIATDFEAKGDLISASAASTPVRLPVGTTGQVLKANSATTSGLEWATSAADIEGVTAGTGLTGGGTSGTVTLALDSAAVIAPTIVNAKGDLISASADNTPAILSVGTNGQVLTAASGEATGLSWATPAAGGMTLISTTTLTGATVTIGSIPSTYNDLHIYIEGFRPITDSTYITFQFNGDATAGNHHDENDGTNYTNLAWGSGTLGSLIGAVDNGLNTDLIHAYIPRYANSTTWKFLRAVHLGANASTPANIEYDKKVIMYKSTTAISSFKLSTTGSGFTSGTVYLYGVK
jgi:hypothetical protein